MGGREFIILFVGLGIPVCLLLGSIALLRCVKNWATIALLTGSILMLASFGVWGSALLFMSGQDWSLLIYVLVAGILLAVGVLAFCAGFLGVCAKYGAAARRAQELEGLLEQLQQRMSSGG